MDSTLSRFTGQRQRCWSRASGFTLVELLVVIAIIGLLAGLLIPAVNRVKHRAKNIACVSQLRQLGMAVRMYTDDHRNRLPSAELLPSSPVNPQSPLPRICDVLAAYVGKAGPVTNSVPVFKCPSDAAGRFGKEGSSYEWNVELNGRPMDETRSGGLKFVRVIVVNGEEVEHTEEEKELLFPPETTPLLLDYEEYHPRSPKPGKNLVFMDGHVAPLEPSKEGAPN
ncbi:MAG: type II secretion system GspH family protein [Verrucomicrobiales bacterium]|nr:type II secretion system GspH family protein [Verrucomicrobiales bacterium]